MQQRGIQRCIGSPLQQQLRGFPSKCPCGQKFGVNPALNCKHHNNIRDFEANLLRKVHNQVETEPPLQAVND